MIYYLNRFSGGCAVVIVNDPKFYSNQKGLGVSGIYSYFRVGTSIQGVISNPMPKGPKQLTINNSYNAIWNSTNFWDRDTVTGSLNLKPAQFYIIEV